MWHKYDPREGSITRIAVFDKNTIAVGTLHPKSRAMGLDHLLYNELLDCGIWYLLPEYVWPSNWVWMELPKKRK